MKPTTRLLSAILLCLTLMTMMCPAAFAATPTTPADLELKLSAPSSTVILGDSVTITVTATNKSASYALDFLDFTLAYDRSMLNYTAGSADAGTEYTGLMVVDDADGLIVRYIADGSNTKKAVAQGGKMEIKFTFTPAKSTTDPVNITFNEPRGYCRSNLANSSIVGNNILHTFAIDEPYSTLSLTMRSQSSNANLSSLTVKVDNVEKTLSPVFSANVTSYTFTADEPVGAVVISCTCQDTNATYKQVQAGLVYTITVTAENGTTKEYTVTLNSTPTTTTTTTTTTTATTTTTTTVATTTSTLPTDTTPTEPTQPSDGTVVSDSTVGGGDDKGSGLLATVNISILGLIGLVAGEIGLFMLAFLSGYMTHKNAARPPKISLEDLVAAQAQAEQDGLRDEYEDELLNAEDGEVSIFSDVLSDRYTPPQFSPQASFGSPAENLIQNGYDMGGQGGMMPGMDDMGMQSGYDMSRQGMMPGMDGMGMQPDYDMSGQGMMPGMDGMGVQPGYDMSGQSMMPGMDGMGMPSGYDMNGQGMMPGMDGMGMPSGYDMNGPGMMPGMDGMGMPSGYDMNGQGGYGM